MTTMNCTTECTRTINKQVKERKKERRKFLKEIQKFHLPFTLCYIYLVVKYINYNKIDRRSHLIFLSVFSTHYSMFRPAWSSSGDEKNNGRQTTPICSLCTNICTNKYCKLILKSLRLVSVLIHLLQGVYKLC
jgi:hypothetical protein